MKIQDMTWPEIGNAISSGYTTAVFSLGSTEQHGPALPEYTDTVQGDYIAGLVTEKLGKALQAPTINIGCSDHHLAFPGSLSLRKTTLQAIIEDVTASLVHHGFRTIIILPFHGGNYAPTAEILPKLRELHPDSTIIAFTDLGRTARVVEEMSVKRGFRPEEIGAHADAWESSNMMHLAPESVTPELFAEGYTGVIGEKERDMVFNKGMDSLTKNGILGDSRRSAVEHGKVFLHTMADFLTEWVNMELQSHTDRSDNLKNSPIE